MPQQRPTRKTDVFGRRFGTNSSEFRSLREWRSGSSRDLPARRVFVGRNRRQSRRGAPCSTWFSPKWKLPIDLSLRTAASKPGNLRLCPPERRSHRIRSRCRPWAGRVCLPPGWRLLKHPGCDPPKLSTPTELRLSPSHFETSIGLAGRRNTLVDRLARMVRDRHLWRSRWLRRAPSATGLRRRSSRTSTHNNLWS